MSKRKNNKVTLAECPIGLFKSDHGSLCVKTEYGNNEGRIDAMEHNGDDGNEPMLFAKVIAEARAAIGEL